MCLLDRINRNKKKIREGAGYKKAPLMGTKQEFEAWKSSVYNGSERGIFIVVPQTLNEEIEIYHSELTDNGIKIIKGEYKES